MLYIKKYYKISLETCILGNEMEWNEMYGSVFFLPCSPLYYMFTYVAVDQFLNTMYGGNSGNIQFSFQSITLKVCILAIELFSEPDGPITKFGCHKTVSVNCFVFRL